MRKRDIVAAATELLKKEFKDHTVLTDETQEGFKRPAFFIELLQHTSNEMLNFTSNRITVIITYLPKKHTALDNMDTGDRIKKLFGMVMPVGRRKLKFEDVEFAQAGENKEILQVYLRAEYYEMIEREETADLMRELKYRHKRSVT